jgi:hypothetical protein
MIGDEIWVLERRLWLEGAEAYDEILHPECIMAFAAPIGIMKGQQISQSLKGAPRWEHVAMEQQCVARPDERTIVLAYVANGHRTNSVPYAAYCTSTYRRQPADWRMIQHQQTPISKE